jgi:hypothetical protein
MGESKLVELEDRLAGYEVTHAPRIPTVTGLPVPPPPTEVSAAVSIERRSERRQKVNLPVVASHPGRDDGLDGVTVDVSLAGLLVVMGEPPDAVHQDAVVAHGDGFARLWVRVIDARETPGGNWVWHLSVTEADDDWQRVVSAASAPVAQPA